MGSCVSTPVQVEDSKDTPAFCYVKCTGLVSPRTLVDGWKERSSVGLGRTGDSPRVWGQTRGSQRRGVGKRTVRRSEPSTRSVRTEEGEDTHSPFLDPRLVPVPGQSREWGNPTSTPFTRDPCLPSGGEIPGGSHDHPQLRPLSTSRGRRRSRADEGVGSYFHKSVVCFVWSG